MTSYFINVSEETKLKWCEPVINLWNGPTLWSRRSKTSDWSWPWDEINKWDQKLEYRKRVKYVTTNVKSVQYRQQIPKISLSKGTLLEEPSISRLYLFFHSKDFPKNPYLALSHMVYNTRKFVRDWYVMKGTLHKEHSTFSSVSLPPIIVFSLNATSCTQIPWPTTLISLVAIGV